MAEGRSLERVLVTGASGYIASHVIHQLLLAKDENGRAKYTVRGTVRDASNEKKCGPLKELAAKIGDGAESRLELVSCDLCKDDGWESAVEGCDYVQHLASPFPPAVPKDPDELIKPAVEGVERVLNAAAKEKSVKRVIVTSSMAAVSGGAVPSRSHKPNDHVFTEEDWSDPDLCPPYEASKTLAERRAWELWKALPEDSRFGLVTILPVAVVGPLLITCSSTSVSFITTPMRNTAPNAMLPDLNLPLVDVRDVTKLHVAAMTRDGVVGNRYLACAEEVPSLALYEVGQFLKEHYGPQGYKVTTRRMPNWTVGMMKHFISDLKLIAPMLAIKVRHDMSKSKNDFDFEYISVRKSILECAESCIEFGLIPEPKGGRRLPNQASSGAEAEAAAAGSDADQTAVETPPQTAVGDEDAGTAAAEKPADGPETTTPAAAVGDDDAEQPSPADGDSGEAKQ